MMNVNFKANYISPAKILKKDVNNEYKPFEVSFVEFDPSDSKDVFALREAASSWEGADQYGKEIARDIKTYDYYYKDLDLEEPKHRFFGITRQKSNFENPRPLEILGMVEITNKGNDRQSVSFLQVDPETNMHSDERFFKGVGSAILREVKKIFSQCEITLRPVSSMDVINFYQKNGFELMDYSLNMIWHGLKVKK